MSAFLSITSAYPPTADLPDGVAEGPFLTQSGHCAFEHSWEFGGLGRWVATALFNHLLGQRAYLIDKMTNARHRGGHVSVWVPLLAQVQVAIEAVESAMKEALTPG